MSAADNENLSDSISSNDAGGRACSYRKVENQYQTLKRETFMSHEVARQMSALTHPLTRQLKRFLSLMHGLIDVAKGPKISSE